MVSLVNYCAAKTGCFFSLFSKGEGQAVGTIVSWSRELESDWLGYWSLQTTHQTPMEEALCWCDTIVNTGVLFSMPRLWFHSGWEEELPTVPWSEQSLNVEIRIVHKSQGFCTISAPHYIALLLNSENIKKYISMIFCVTWSLGGAY